MIEAALAGNDKSDPTQAPIVSNAVVQYLTPTEKAPYVISNAVLQYLTPVEDL